MADRIPYGVSVFRTVGLMEPGSGMLRRVHTNPRIAVVHLNVGRYLTMVPVDGFKFRALEDASITYMAIHDMVDNDGSIIKMDPVPVPIQVSKGDDLSFEGGVPLLGMDMVPHTVCVKCSHRVFDHQVTTTCPKCYSAMMRTR